MIPFYQRIPRIIFKICFSRSYMPSRATKQIHYRNFTCPQTCFSRTETLGECQVTPLHICQPFITDLFIFFFISIYYGWKAQLLLYSNQKTHFWKYLASKKLLVVKDWYLKLSLPYFFIGNWPFCHSNGTSFEPNFANGIFWLI